MAKRRSLFGETPTKCYYNVTMPDSTTLFNRSYESLAGIPNGELMSLLEPKTEQAISMEGVSARLAEDRPLHVKFGTDPTGPDLHLGHIVPIRVIDIFSRAGHHIDLIFGDFTAKVGDPTDRSGDRPILTDEEIATNMATFEDQVDRFFDTQRENVHIHTNNSWLGNMALSEVFGYLQAINLTEATQRKDFRERIQQGRAVSLAEAIYGTLMGIDSVHLGTDVEVGGVDQLLNFQQTRAVQRSRGQKAEEIIMTPIIEGTSGDGRKMSKSYGNYVPVRAEVDEIFGRIMSIPDGLILPYLKAFAPVYESELKGLQQAIDGDPLEAKKQLATYMASLASGSAEAGASSRETFERRFADKNITDEDAIPLVCKEGSLIDALIGSGAFKSKGELRRLAEQGGVRVNGQKIDPGVLTEGVTAGTLITVGKRKVFKITDQA